MGHTPILPYRPPSAEEQVRRSYVSGLIDVETMERALHEIIVDGHRDVPDYVPFSPADEIGRSLRVHEFGYFSR